MKNTTDETPQALAMATGSISPEHRAMELPTGKTCADCKFVARCEGMGYSWRERLSCDFYPRRYLERSNVGYEPRRDKKD